MLGNAEGLKNGSLSPNDLPPIRVWRDPDGNIWTLDHRRLVAFNLAGLDEVPCQWVSYDCAMDQWWKMTTVNGGKSIKLTFDDGDYIIVGEDG